MLRAPQLQRPPQNGVVAQLPPLRRDEMHTAVLLSQLIVPRLLPPNLPPLQSSMPRALPLQRSKWRQLMVSKWMDARHVD